MANSGGLKTSKRYVPNHASHLLHLHDRSREVVIWICYLPFVTSVWESEETPIWLMCAWHISSLSWEQMSALFTNVGSNVGYNSMVGIAISEMNSDQTFCGFQLQLVCVPSFSQSLGRRQVWDFLQCSAVIITFIWEGRHLLKCSHCSSTYVNRVGARVGVWQQCLSSGSSQPSQTSRKWRRDTGKVPVQVTGRARIWERQFQFPRSWVIARVYCHWPKPTRP